ncbi:MAG TPA: tetratricopeptide repeat protein [Longimicrobiales bacterium]
MSELPSLSTRARTLYDQRQYAELAALLTPLREQLVESAPYLAFYLADAWRRLGRQPAALELVNDFAAASKRSGIARLELDRLNLEGMLRFETGDIDGAEASWRELLAEADAEGNDDFVARANNNLGIIFTLDTRSAEAAVCYQRAIGAYTTIGSRRGLAQSHQNLAITYRELRQFDDADEHFTRAIRFARESESDDEVARAEQERALLIYQARRDAQLARVTVNRAIDRFSTLNDPVGVSDATRVLAMIELGEGDAQSAAQRGESALLSARQVGHVLLQAELLEVLAAAARKQGAAEGAQTFEAEASAAFERVHASAWGQQFRRTVQAL